jgi:hypothetical protein
MNTAQVEQHKHKEHTMKQHEDQNTVATFSGVGTFYEIVHINNYGLVGFVTSGPTTTELGVEETMRPLVEFILDEIEAEIADERHEEHVVLCSGDYLVGTQYVNCTNPASRSSLAGLCAECSDKATA